MSLIKEFYAFVRIEGIASNFVGSYCPQLMFVHFVEPVQSQFESLTVDDNIIVEGVQQLRCAFLGEAIAMVH